MPTRLKVDRRRRAKFNAEAFGQDVQAWVDEQNHKLGRGQRIRFLEAMDISNATMNSIVKPNLTNRVSDIAVIASIALHCGLEITDYIEDSENPLPD